MSYADLPRRVIITNPHREKKISSYGVIAYAKNTRRWLLVQCKYSPGLSYIFYGAYRPAYIQNILLNMIRSEVEWIKKVVGLPEDEGKEEFARAYQENLGRPLESFQAYDRICDLKNEILEYDVSQNLGERTFSVPKGRSSPREDSRKAALREFREETGVSAPYLFPETVFLENSGMTGRRYNIKCWICVIEEEVDLNNHPEFDKYEIEDRAWVEFDLKAIPLGYIVTEYISYDHPDGRKIFIDHEAIDLCRQALQIITHHHSESSGCSIRGEDRNSSRASSSSKTPSVWEQAMNKGMP